MKKIWLLLILLVSITGSVHAQQQVVLQDSIVGNVTLTNDKTYLIRGFVYIVNGSTLTIQPGTLLFGEKSTKGTIIAEPGGKLIAIGTASQPIVFTSSQPKGSRDRGDWGGIVLCGRAPINQNNTINGGTAAGGDAQVEGGPRTHYGGTDEHDNSGALSYVRVEFPGIALSPNNEINGITFGGVGDGTQIDHCQVSYSGDDSYEWFGGSVRGKYLIALRGIDDDWDTDFGWHGALQFCASLRDPNVADVSGSNGFESDNDASGHFWNPRTSARLSNLTVVGPMVDTSQAAFVNPLFRRGAHLRRNTQESIYNSIIMGWPDGVLIDGDGTANGAKNDTLQIRNTIVAGLRPGHDFLTAGLTGGNTFDAAAWFNTTSYANQALGQSSAVHLTDPFNLTQPNWTPQANSPANTLGSFTNSRLQDPFFTPVAYAGAFDPNGARWDRGWSNYDPQNTDYVAVATPIASVITFPNIPVGTSYDTTVVLLRNTGNGPLVVTNWYLTDTTNFKVIGGTSPFSLGVGGTKTVVLRFVATDTIKKIQGINIQYDGGLPPTAISLEGKGTQTAPAITLYPSSNFDFAYVRVGDSATSTVIITNSGTAPLTISGTTITGPEASQFRVLGVSSNTIAPKGTTTITMSFKPASVGTKVAALHIASNVGAGTTNVNLTGKGVVVVGQDVLKDSIVGNVTLTNDRTWLVRGYLYVVNGSVLNIEPGTVIFGEKASKGSIIVEPGGKINAVGTPEHPIVFTSQAPKGSRDRGDWGGIILAGRAPINQNNTSNGGTKAGGDAQVEGGPRTHYGGTDEHDNSGVMSYCRIEFPGVALSPNNEINGLTFGGVGDATQIDHIQVSYSGDDSYEWFGGSVNGKYLIALRGIDDEWDTDFGWHGKLQFCASLRDPNIADVSGSNGFESDNDASGHYWNPRTSARLSNMTVIGPMSDTSKASTINPLFRRGAHLRRSTQESIYNSIVMGWPDGILVDGDGAANGAKSDTLQIRNSIWAGLRPGHDFLTAALSSGNTFDAGAWFKTASFGNQALVQPADVKLTNAFDLTNPDFRPMAGSPALNVANFSNARLSDPFFTPVTYAGAFAAGAPRWDSGWTNYDPQNADYSTKSNISRQTIDFGKISVGHTAYDSVTITNNGLVPVSVTSLSLGDTSAVKIVGLASGFTVEQGATQTVHLAFTPTHTGIVNTTLRLVYRDESSSDVQITGEGVILSGVSRTEAAREINLRNQPNPFTGTTQIAYNVPVSGVVSMEVYDLTGRKVTSLVNEFESEGPHTVSFDGSTLTKGVYYCKLAVNGISLVLPITSLR